MLLAVCGRKERGGYAQAEMISSKTFSRRSRAARPCANFACQELLEEAEDEAVGWRGEVMVAISSGGGGGGMTINRGMGVDTRRRVGVKYEGMSCF